MSKIILSVITPCFNEVNSIQKCVDSLRNVMSQQLPEIEYEHILTDNASNDGTAEILRKIAMEDSKVRVIIRSKNIGAPRNIYAALEFAKGEAIIPMLPADLQDPADLIPDLYREWEKGFSIVYGVRKNRQESFLLRTGRTLFYKIIHKFSEATIVTNAGEFMLIDKRILQSILDVKDENPFIRGLVAQSGAKFSTIPYTWTKRNTGKSKATPLVLIDQAINGLVSTSRIPARLALLFGFGLSIFSILLGIYSTLGALLDASSPLPGIPTVIVAVFLFSGIQLFFLGLIGEYVLSIHGQIKPEPKSFLVEIHNFDKES
jgi:glycosyltransferase involved in cell wall biosynthesis